MTFGQSSKAFSATSVFLDTLTRVREVQPQKAPYPIDVTEGERLMWAREVQPSKAQSPIDVTEGGRLIWVREVQSEKALSPIDATEGGIIVFEHPLINVLLSV